MTNQQIKAIFAAQLYCTTCGRDPWRPYRVFDPATGKVIQGCVDEFHSGHLTPCSESAFWHYRKAASTIRRQNRIMRFGK